DLLRDIYAKRVDIEKLGYIGKAEGEILVSVFPCLSKSDKPGMGYMSIDRLYDRQIKDPEKVIPTNYLPFATDGFGNDFYLDLDNPTSTDIIYGNQMVFFDEPDPIRFTVFRHD
ncbi:MAG: SMI1/KNR4 family protein, partial [Candidatus Ancillula sp.]|nr:SMI1/KNR4 family protein [Candidatus Ancillula sp.]